MTGRRPIDPPEIALARGNEDAFPPESVGMEEAEEGGFLALDAGEADEAADEPEPEPAAPLAKGLERKADANLSYSAPSETGEATDVSGAAKAEPKVGRNQPCPCGSGKKYKMCHGRRG